MFCIIFLEARIKSPDPVKNVWIRNRDSGSRIQSRIRSQSVLEITNYLYTFFVNDEIYKVFQISIQNIPTLSVPSLRYPYLHKILPKIYENPWEDLKG